MFIVPYFHGSTALENVVASSTDLATLCTARTHECEGQWLIMGPDKGFEKAPQAPDRMFWSASTVLQRLSPYWDLARPVLLYKDAGFFRLAAWSERAEDKGNGHTRMWRTVLDQQRLSTVPLPPAMRAAGIERLRLSYIIMWRPWCMWSLSSETREAYGTDASKWATKELIFHENQARYHKELAQLGIATLVVSYADLIWEPDLTARRLQAFLPCLHGIDVDFVMQEGVDYFDGNDFKIRSSIREFGQSHPPETCQYNRQSARCWESPEKRRYSPHPQALPPDQRARARAAVEYLQLYSRHTGMTA